MCASIGDVNVGLHLCSGNMNSRLGALSITLCAVHAVPTAGLWHRHPPSGHEAIAAAVSANHAAKQASGRRLDRGCFELMPSVLLTTGCASCPASTGRGHVLVWSLPVMPGAADLGLRLEYPPRSTASHCSCAALVLEGSDSQAKMCLNGTPRSDSALSTAAGKE